MLTYNEKESLKNIINKYKCNWVRVLRKHEHKIYKILQELKNKHNFKAGSVEIAYWLINDLVDFPKCKCGNKCNFIKKQNRYNNYCTKCFIKSEEVQNKKRNTCLKTYGVEIASKSKIVKEKIGKTNLEKYGNICSLHGEQCIKNKKETWIKKYGIDIPFKSEIIKNKIKNTCLERYGVEYITQTKEYKEKCKETCKIRYGVDHHFSSNEIKLKIKHTLLNLYGVEHVGQLSQKQYSKISQELFWQIYNNLSDELKDGCYFAELNNEWFISDTGFFAYADFCIPSLKLIIEFQGDYWHMNPDIYAAEDVNTVMNKTAEDIWANDKNRIDKLEKLGWKVIQIWETEYKTRQFYTSDAL